MGIDQAQPVAVRYSHDGADYYVTGSSGKAKAFSMQKAMKVQLEVATIKGNAELVQYDQVPEELRHG